MINIRCLGVLILSLLILTLPVTAQIAEDLESDIIVTTDGKEGNINESEPNASQPYVKPTLFVSGKSYDVVETTEDAKFEIVKDTVAESVNAFAISVYDIAKGVATVVTADDKGEVANAPSDHVSVDTNGRFAVFHSWATNLVDSSPTCANVYLKDTATGWIVMLRPRAMAPVISEDGKYAAYEYVDDFMTGTPSMYRYSIDKGTEEFIDVTSLGNTKGGWYSPNPSINSDGSIITYHTTKNGYPEVWEWNNGKLSKIRDGTL